MLIGALAGFLTSKFTGSPVLGLVAGGTTGALLAGIHGVVCLGLQGNQVVSGLALTILGTGLSSYWGTPFIGQKAPGFAPVAVPVLSGIPGLGEVFFSHDPLVYLSYVIAPLMWCFFRYTSLGARHPIHRRASRGGIGRRASCAPVPLGGSPGRRRTHGFRRGRTCPLAYTHLWTNGLSAGRGWIAVALVIFTFWRPGRAILGAYLFGGVMAFQLRLQAMGTTLPSSLLLMLPYALTIIVLVVSSWRQQGSEMPAALGINLEPNE